MSTRYVHLFANIRNWWTYFLHKHLWSHSQRPEIRYSTRTGLHLPVPAHRFAEFKEVFVQQVYWPPAWQNLEPPTIRCVIDAGANIGLFTLFAAQHFPAARIIAMEPIAENHQRLTHLLHTNQLNRAKAIRAALSGQDGNLTLRFDSTEAFTTAATIFAQSTYRPDWQPEHVQEETVPCFTLATLMQREALEQCDLLKLDCEGSEYDILYHADPTTLARIKRLAIETHPGPEPDQRLDALENFLRQNGFNTWSREAMLYAQRQTSPV